MIAVPLTEEALRVAFQRIHDFKSVHSGEENIIEPWEVLRGSLGIDAARVEQIVGESEELFNRSEGDDEHFYPGVLFGLVLGLIAADYGQEVS